MSRHEDSRNYQVHREAIFQKYEGICHICGGKHADAIDHVVPQAKGGSHHPDNLRPAHTSCNSRKRDSDPPDWAYENANMWKPGFGGGRVEDVRSQAESRREALRSENQRKSREVAAKKAEDSAAKMAMLLAEISKVSEEISAVTDEVKELRSQSERKIFPPRWSLITSGLAWIIALVLAPQLPEYGGWVFVGLAAVTWFFLAQARTTCKQYRTWKAEQPEFVAAIKYLQGRLQTLREQLRVLERRLPRAPYQYRYRGGYRRGYRRRRY